MEELRQQIRMLQAVGYNTMDEEDDGDGQRGDAGSDSQSGSGGGGTTALSSGGKGGKGPSVGIRIAGGPGGSMEAALLQKNRHLEHELTMARLKGVDTKAELDAALARLNDLEAQVCRR